MLTCPLAFVAQMIKLQETPDGVPDGQTPQTALAFAFDALVDSVCREEEE